MRKSVFFFLNNKKCIGYLWLLPTYLSHGVPCLRVSPQAPAAGPLGRLWLFLSGRGRDRGPFGELVQSGGESVQQSSRLGDLHHLQRQ